MRRVLVMLCLATGGCQSPSGPSAAPIPDVTGSYQLTVTPCSVDSSSSSPSSFGLSWNLSQQGNAVTGNLSTSNPPGYTSGSLHGSISRAGTLEISSLDFRSSSTHTGLTTLIGSGRGILDGDDLSGTVSGDWAFVPAFGGLGGDRVACHGASMPFRFSRR